MSCISSFRVQNYSFFRTFYRKMAKTLSKKQHSVISHGGTGFFPFGEVPFPLGRCCFSSRKNLFSRRGVFFFSPRRKSFSPSRNFMFQALKLMFHVLEHMYQSLELIFHALEHKIPLDEKNFFLRTKLVWSLVGFLFGSQVRC